MDWVANTTHYFSCYYDRMQERNPFGQPARQYLLLLLWNCLSISAFQRFIQALFVKCGQGPTSRFSSLRNLIKPGINSIPFAKSFLIPHPDNFDLQILILANFFSFFKHVSMYYREERKQQIAYKTWIFCRG